MNQFFCARLMIQILTNNLLPICLRAKDADIDVRGLRARTIYNALSLDIYC